MTDVFIIGGGPGGYVAAIKAAQFGKKVTLVEKEELGGVCLNWGCIPTKTLLRSAEVLELIKKSSRFGIQVALEHVSVDYARVIEQSRSVAERLSRGVAHLMKKNKIEVVYGIGKFKDKNHVEVTTREGPVQIIEAQNIVIATGARPADLSCAKIDGQRILSSRHVLSSTVLPKTMAIVGAGAIGVEFAYFFQTFGCEVTLIEMLPYILPQADEDISRELEKSFKKQKIRILTSASVQNIEANGENAIISFTRKGREEKVTVERVLVAVGVRANSENLGLEKVGISTEKGWIRVNEHCQTSVPNIYAVGDVIGAPLLAHVAFAEGTRAVNHIAGKKIMSIDYRNIPVCTYCRPQVASVGYTEKQAMEAGYPVKLGRFPLRANGKALALGEEDGLVKIILDEKYGELLGCHIIGPDATEIITQIALARTARATYQELLQTVHPHPTITEAVFEATLDALGLSLHI